MDKLADGLIAVLTAIVGLAVVAVIFSRSGQTASVITAGGNAFSSIIKSAVAPVS
ncbi:MAG: hypothetical protein KGJ13_05410 [Patescibacteria group bacterium]|nr:hypothetical protein [Patescibacteria group bacterium]